MLSIFVIIFSVFVSVNSFALKYHNNSELEEYLKNFTRNGHSDIKTTLYSIGKSIKGHNLWVLNLTAAKYEKIGIPNIKFIGTIHGNEPVGREILLYFMEYLRDNYSTNREVRWLLDNTRIHFLPNMNPDGFDDAFENNCEGSHGRTNGKHDMDLNRNFPDYFHKRLIPETAEAAETKAVRKWMQEVPFILSAGLHGGALVANYPFDTVKELTSEAVLPPSLTPDNDVFQHLATIYAQNHPTMHRGYSCTDTVEFKGGITNGAAWYSFSGGMQDYNYAIEGCMELTLEISCCKYPKAKELPELWNENKKALLKFSAQAHRGVTGRIVDSTTLKPIVEAALKISGRNIVFFSKQKGEFWRILLPGNYSLEVSAQGYYDRVVPFEVKSYNNSFPKLTTLRIYLKNSSISTTTATPVTTPQQISTNIETLTVDVASTASLLADVVINIPEQSRQISFIEEEEERRNSTAQIHLHSYLLLLISYCNVLF